METPNPVNIKPLISKLIESRKLMNKVDSIPRNRDTSIPIYNQRNGQGLPPPDYSNTRSVYSEVLQNDPIYENTQSGGYVDQSGGYIDYDDQQVMNSKLPSNIKQAMINNKIPKVSPLISNFKPEEIAMIRGNQPVQHIQQSNQYGQYVNESQVRQYQSSEIITISRNDLQNMINESINDFFRENYNKTITEEAIKKTISLLIKEGKITPRKKPI